MSREPMLEKITNWAKNIATIRAIYLIGSRAEEGEIDCLSDYDIAVFVSDVNPFIKTSSWMKDIDDLLFFQKSKFYYNSIEIETRLVIYENYQRVDFSFWNNNILKDFIKNGIPDMFNIGYQTLIDKDGFSSKLAKPTYEGYIEGKPTKDLFLKSVCNFWFEIYCIVKYLKRKDYFYSIILRRELDNHILQITKWYMQSKNLWTLKINSLGKRMQSWVDDEIWEELSSIYSNFKFDDCWTGLLKLTNYYIRLARHVAYENDYTYPEKIEQYIKKFMSN